MDKETCHCHSSASSAILSETLEELDFRRSLCSAAQENDLELIRQRLSSPSASKWINQADSSGYTPLHYAMRHQPAEVCRLLLEHGANPNCQTRASLSTPLHRAILFRNRQAIDLLLKYQADVNLKDIDGHTPKDKAKLNQFEF